MARKRSLRKSGTIVVLEHRSKVLAGNALGDPHVRKLAVWLPTNTTGAHQVARASIYQSCTTSSVTGSGLSHLNWRPFGERLAERMTTDPRGRMGRRSPCCPTASRASEATVRQLVGARPLRRLPARRDHAVRRPRVPHARVTRASRMLRQVVRRLRRDDPRHEIRRALGRGREPLGRFVFRVRLRRGLAEHAERARETPPAAAACGRASNRRQSRTDQDLRQGSTTAACDGSSRSLEEASSRTPSRTRL